MSDFEVPQPILNSPFDEPREYWWIVAGQPLERREGRRKAMYYYHEPTRDSADRGGYHVELPRVNLIRERLAEWRRQGWPGVSRITLDLLRYWHAEERQQRLFFAQLEAAETVAFLTEARADLRQGVEVPRDEPSDEVKAQGYAGFRRYACKMATGAGKTTVMGMLAAWSILNKVTSRGDARFSDAVLVVCPNVTIRDRLRELDPALGAASLYRTRDLVPAHLMPQLNQGKVLVTNWHGFQPQVPATAGDGGKVVKAGTAVQTTETIRIGDKNDTKRGTRWLTRETLHLQLANGLLDVLEGDPDNDTTLKIRSTRYLESDTAVVNRVLRDIGGKKNLLVFNDEAHHAYRVKVERPDDWDDMDSDEREEWLSDQSEATVWIDGLDRIHKGRGINVCIDLSATPYWLNRVGQDANRPFPWVVSDFGLIDAIESGLVKIPQLAVRDPSGADIPGYFNIWQWIMQPGRLTSAERGGKRANPKPEAILKWANTPIAMLGGLWQTTWQEWQASGTETRPPVFIIVCKNTALADVVFAWIAENRRPPEVPECKLTAFRNSETANNTIVVHSKVVADTDSGNARGDDARWMRFTLDTVGRQHWPSDTIGHPLYPEGFVELAQKLGRSFDPPGRDIRCIVSVGMLTEGWDCNTVTHIVGLRPFMSQLLCEQVVGRGLRRTRYDVDEQGLMSEEVAKIFGVPFQIVPFKANPGTGATVTTPKRKHVQALPARAQFEIHFPRVEGYTQSVHNRVSVAWASINRLALSPDKIAPEVTMKGVHGSNEGRLSLHGPGRADQVTLEAFRKDRRLQELVFDVAAHLTHLMRSDGHCEIPPHALFPQLAAIIERFIRDYVDAPPPADKKDLFLAPYYGWMVETLRAAIHGDTDDGEVAELPVIERSRGAGSTSDVDFWTSRPVVEVAKSHVNYLVADTDKWEQSAAYHIDNHASVDAFVKNAGLGLGVPYLHNGEQHEYLPDFVIRLTAAQRYLLLETKGYDPLKDVKRSAAERWCQAVNQTRAYGQWRYAMATSPEQVREILGAL